MGMYDDIKCSYDIGKLTNRECQSKEFDYYGGTMSFYWVDPNGLLWTPDYNGTMAIEYIDSDEPIWRRIKYTPTGVHGRFQRVYKTDYVTIYTCDIHENGYTEYIDCRLHFVNGVLKDFKYLNTQLQID